MERHPTKRGAFPFVALIFGTSITQVDSGFETSELGLALTELGHMLELVAEIGVATGIVINPDGTMIAAAEPSRRGGGSAQTVEN